MPLAGVAMFASAAPAMAQDAGASQDLDDVIVTGSRIAVDAVTASAGPVQVITAEQFKQAGEIDITQMLREIPALQGSDRLTSTARRDLPWSGQHA